MESDKNPYIPPGSDKAGIVMSSQGVGAAFRWRIFPAFLIGLLGIASFGFGILAVAIMMFVLLTEQDTSLLTEMLAGCTLYLGFGAFWIASGVFVWKTNYRFAILSALIGVAIPMTIVSILGF